MPGPSNRKNKPRRKATASSTNSGQPLAALASSCPMPSQPMLDDPANAAQDGSGNPGRHHTNDQEYADAPYIENKWNGPRTIDICAFISSSYAVPPSMEDTNCATFAASKVRDMFIRVLPQDVAWILWYNKSRKSARVCPACRRFYSTGDLLMPHLIDHTGSRFEYVDPRNLREKEISGICSVMCFGIASYNWPGSIGAWGKWASEIDAETRAIWQGVGENVADQGLGAFMQLARNEDLLTLIYNLSQRGLKLY